jgi:hypothetical protein
MIDESIEAALRAGPPDERPHRQGALERGIAARSATGDRPPGFRVTVRSPGSPAPALLLAAAVAVVVIALIGGVLGSARPTPTLSPTSSPYPGATASPSGSLSPSRGAPAQLVDRWVGPVRPIPGLAKPPTRALLDILGVGFSFDAGPGQPNDLLASSVTQVGTDGLRLTALSPTEGCRPFDEGDYRWTLSAGGSNLRVDLVDDACAARAAALPGTWTHTQCREAGTDCLGPVEAGTYRSTDFDPFRTGSSGQLTYTLPDGWANSGDHPVNYALRPAADYRADPGFDGNDTIGGIYFWAGTVAADQPADCAAMPANGVDVSAAAIAAHIAQLDGLTIVDQGTQTIAGRTARLLDLSLDPAYHSPCPWSGGDPFRSLILFADAGRDGGVQGLAPGEKARIAFLDVAPGRVLSIWIDGDASRFDTLVSDAAPILESLELAPHPSSP